jgi:hypothetical protein
MILLAALLMMIVTLTSLLIADQWYIKQLLRKNKELKEEIEAASETHLCIPEGEGMLPRVSHEKEDTHES